VRHALALAAWVALEASAAEPLSSQAAFDEAVQYDCNARPAALAAPETETLGERRYVWNGTTVQVRRTGKVPATVKLGLLAGIKDFEPETKALLEVDLREFEARDVEAIVVGGDSGEQPEVLEALYGFLATATARPVLAIAGNTERVGAHNHALLQQRLAGHRHLINMGSVRRFDGQGVDVVAVSGYHDQRYLHQTGACLYTDRALDEAAALAAQADDPVVLLSHGPPRQRGDKALDFVPGIGNVGDPALGALLEKAKIRFGAFGHILEAGGQGTDLGGRPVAPGKTVPSLYVNQGSANTLPWKLNAGPTSHGLAAVLTVGPKGGSYEVLRAPKP